MLTIVYGREGSGKTYYINDTYHTIRLTMDNIWNDIGLFSHPMRSEKETVIWLEASTEKVEDYHWRRIYEMEEKSPLDVFVEVRVKPNLDRILSDDRDGYTYKKIVADPDEVRAVLKEHGVSDIDTNMRRIRGNWWRCQSLIQGATLEQPLRGYGEWTDSREIFMKKSLDPTLPRKVVGAYENMGKYYPFVRKLNTILRKQGIRDVMVKNIINVLPRRSLQKHWAIPYRERDGSPFHKWLLDSGLTREDYYLAKEYPVGDLVDIARDMIESKYWKKGWRSLQQKIPEGGILSIRDVLHIVFEVEPDDLPEEGTLLDII